MQACLSRYPTASRARELRELLHLLLSNVKEQLCDVRTAFEHKAQAHKAFIYSEVRDDPNNGFEEPAKEIRVYCDVCKIHTDIQT